tara:strand:+ start:928 stop:1293 length:366 start_codon:yes stop_codon:yes gene_type:complete
MAHFAKLNSDNIVTTVIVVNNTTIQDANGVEQEQIGVDFINGLYGTSDVWKQTSYNRNFRKNFAGLNFIYDETRDAFIQPQPYNSWVLNNSTCIWEAPVSHPGDGKRYVWNETTTAWDLWS